MQVFTNCQAAALEPEARVGESRGKPSEPDPALGHRQAGRVDSYLPQSSTFTVESSPSFETWHRIEWGKLF